MNSALPAGVGLLHADLIAFDFFRRRADQPQRMVGAEVTLAADPRRE